MKSLFRTVYSTRLLGLIGVMLLCAGASAQEGAPYWVVAKSGLNLRATASSKGEKIVTIPNGEEVKLVDKSGKKEKVGKVTGEWFRISWKDKTGYAFSGFLSAGSPISIDAQKPLQDQIQKVCFGSKDEPPNDCSGQCGNTYFILDANQNYLRARAGGPPGCQGVSWTDTGKWSVSTDAIVLMFEDTKQCFTTCEDYCSQRVYEEESMDCTKHCPVNGKIPEGCPANMTSAAFREKYGKKYQIVLKRNKKGEFIIQKGGPEWRAGTNFGLPYLPK
jgi:hypothetical protein